MKARNISASFSRGVYKKKKDIYIYMYKTGKIKVKSITHLPEYTLNRPGEGEKKQHRAIQPNISR